MEVGEQLLRWECQAPGQGSGVSFGLVHHPDVLGVQKEFHFPTFRVTDGFLVSELSPWPPWLPVARHLTGGRGHISARHRHELPVLTPFLSGASGVDLGRCSQLSQLIPGRQTRVSRARRAAGPVSLTAAGATSEAAAACRRNRSRTLRGRGSRDSHLLREPLGIPSLHTVPK